MSSICKKTPPKKAMKGRNRPCDQRNKIICIYCHGSRPLEPNKMWRVSRKTNSASQHTALFVSAAFIGICQANTGLKAAFQLFLLCQIAGIVCLILKEVFNRNLSVALVVVWAAVLSCSYMFKRGWSLYIFGAFPLHTPRVLNIEHSEWAVVLSQFDWPCCVFVWVKNSHPFLPWLRLTLAHIVYVKHKHMHVRLYRPLVGPAQSFTVDSQVLVQSSWQEPASIFPPRHTS